jgi:hypothetical protein
MPSSGINERNFRIYLVVPDPHAGRPWLDPLFPPDPTASVGELISLVFDYPLFAPRRMLLGWMRHSWYVT